MLKETIEYKRFVWEFNNYINQKKEKINNIVFLCLGSNMIIGDGFGPVVGTVLKKFFIKSDKVKIIGDIDNAINYSNIKKYSDNISLKYNNSLIIAIDSALSNRSNIGKIFIQNRGMKYAESLKKKNDLIGNISIKAVVGENVNSAIGNFQNLRNVSERQIFNVANIVSNGIIEVLNKKENIGKNIYK